MAFPCSSGEGSPSPRETGGRYVALARLALAKAGPDPELAMAEADAFLRSGDPLSVLGLFKSRLSVEERPQLWGEAFVLGPQGRGPSPPSSQARRISAASPRSRGMGRLNIDAAARALAAGDVLGARAWISRASSEDLAPAPRAPLGCRACTRSLAATVDPRSNPTWQRLARRFGLAPGQAGRGHSRLEKGPGHRSPGILQDLGLPRRGHRGGGLPSLRYRCLRRPGKPGTRPRAAKPASARERIPWLL